jgi:hypothetical protein
MHKSHTCGKGRNPSRSSGPSSEVDQNLLDRKDTGAVTNSVLFDSEHL